jgi:hypothetical protein
VSDDYLYRLRDAYKFPEWPPVPTQAPAAPRCEDCSNAPATCDPVLTDNRKHHICEACCEDRRQRWDWVPRKYNKEKTA